MKLLGSFSSLFLFAMHVLAGDIAGHALITKRLTKKSLPPIVYNLRGTTAPAVPLDVQPVNEFNRMVVILEGAKSQPQQAVTAVLNQSGSRFDPELIVVPTGSTVQFPNLDPIFHNVFSLSKVKLFDLGYYPKGQTRVVTFPQAGIVFVNCHLHPNMAASIVVTPNAWSTRAAADGHFVLQDIPPGKYEVVAWHKAAGFFRQTVEIGAAPVSLQFLIPLEDPSPGKYAAANR